MRDFFFDDPFFKRSWDDFDKVRDAMFNESRDMWKRFDEDFRDSACMKNNIMLESGMELGKEVSRSFSRKYTLHKDAKAEDVVSNLSSDGVLVITAPKNPAAITNVKVDQK